MNYKEAISYLNSLINLEKDRKLLTSNKSYKLERTRRMLDYFASPDKNYKIFHVAGTNGKGSVATFFYSLMLNNKIKTGLFTSPHILDVRERISFAGKFISKKDFAESVSLIKLYAENNNDAPTYFEAFTVMAAIYFSKKKCTWAVFETGIGGLSDSTNALNTDLSAITSISKDHIQILGSTLAEIAYQKAGIIKKNTPVILGEIKGEALDVIKKTAIDKNAPFFCFKKDFDIKKIRLSLKGSEFIFTPEDRKIFCPKAGKSSAINAAIAFFGAKLFNKKINPVFKLNRYMLAARFDIACKKYPLILDGAHNISAAENLIANLKGLTSKKKFHFLIGFLSDKDFRGFIEVIKPYVKTVSVAKIKSPSDASKEVYSYLKSLGFAPEYFEKPSDFAKNIKNLKKGTPVVITGSFYLCSDIYKNIKSFKKAL